jgi:hypothetical protein
MLTKRCSRHRGVRVSLNTWIIARESQQRDGDCAPWYVQANTSASDLRLGTQLGFGWTVAATEDCSEQAVLPSLRSRHYHRTNAPRPPPQATARVRLESHGYR